MRGSGDGPDKPEDFHKQMQEFLRRQLAGGGLGFGPFSAQPSAEAPPPEPEPKEPDGNFEFGYTPREVKAYLDRFVIRQDPAKKVLSVALCDHYHAVRRAREGDGAEHYVKQNVLIGGPTGVGKTYLIRSLADLIGVPFVKADATKFSETGYVGADVEDLVRDLVRQANGDVKRAEYGIIYIDEIDKLAADRGVQGRDVSGRGVQTNLLKLMEETEVPVRAPNDLSGQLASMMQMTGRGGAAQASSISTRHILFVVSGAFDGLEKIVQRRVQSGTIGFQAADPLATESDAGAWLERAATQDYVDFGFEPEFIGRLPVRVVCRALDEDALFEIMLKSEGSIVRQYERSFAAYGIRARFQESGLRRIASLSVDESTGARGLMTVCERIFRDLKFHLPSTTAEELEIDDRLVDQPAAVLEEMLERFPDRARQEDFEAVLDWARSFEKEHGLQLEFSAEAMGFLVGEARQAGRSVARECRERFKDFPYGLKLLAKNRTGAPFELDLEAVRNPDATLSEWIVRHYRQSGGESETNLGERD